MSYNSVKGIVKSFGTSAAHDFIKEKNLVEVMLQTASGEKIVRVPLGARYRWYPERGYVNDAQIAVGDTVEIGWDYHNFTGIIERFSEPRGAFLNDDTPVVARRIAKEDWIQSAIPETSDKSDMLNALLDAFDSLDD